MLKDELDGTADSTPSQEEASLSSPVYLYLGPDFSHRSILDLLAVDHGLSETGGSIHSFSAVSELEDLPFSSVVITVGADTGIIRPLSRLCESRNDLRIFSLFSLADPVLLEYCNELVLDIARDDTLMASEGESSAQTISDSSVVLLLETVFRYSAGRDWNLSREEQLLRELTAVPDGWTFLPYIDPDTGIRSRNHLQLHIAGTGTS